MGGKKGISRPGGKQSMVDAILVNQCSTKAHRAQTRQNIGDGPSQSVSDVTQANIGDVTQSVLRRCGSRRRRGSTKMECNATRREGKGVSKKHGQCNAVRWEHRLLNASLVPRPRITVNNIA
jgi:hypothetical protein